MNHGNTGGYVGRLPVHFAPSAKFMPRHPAQTPPRPHATYLFPTNPGIPLACPVCQAGLLRDELRFICRGPDCRRTYAIRDGIPLLLGSESTALAPEVWRNVDGI